MPWQWFHIVFTEEALNTVILLGLQGWPWGGVGVEVKVALYGGHLTLGEEADTAVVVLQEVCWEGGQGEEAAGGRGRSCQQMVVG